MNEAIAGLVPNPFTFLKFQIMELFRHIWGGME